MSTDQIVLEHRMSSDYREHRDDPAFYVLEERSRDTWVATLRRGDRKIDIYCQGVMKAYLYEDSNDVLAGIDPEIIRDANALFDHGISSDEDLCRLDDEELLVWQNNPWFDLYGHTRGGHSNDPATMRERHLDCVTHSLREAVETATRVLNDGSRWSL
jgi:hypothetical protein